MKEFWNFVRGKTSLQSQLLINAVTIQVDFQVSDYATYRELRVIVDITEFDRPQDTIRASPLTRARQVRTQVNPTARRMVEGPILT
jgi:hypothetical protein